MAGDADAGMCVCVAPPSPAREMCARIAPPLPAKESPEHVQCAVLHGRLLWLQVCATMVAGLLHGRLRRATRRQIGGRRALAAEALAAARRAAGVGRRERAQAEIVLAWHAAIGQAAASVVARALAVVPPRRSAHRAHRGRVHHAAAPGRGCEVAAGAEGLCPRAHGEGRVLGQRLQRARRAKLAVEQRGLLRLLGGLLPGLVGLHAWWVQASRGTIPAAKAVERCAPATPRTLHTPSLARPPHPSPPHPLPPGGRPPLTSGRCRFEDDHARAALRARQREASRQRIHTWQRLPPRVEVARLGPHPDWRGEEPHAGFVHEHLGQQVSGLELRLRLRLRVKVRDRAGGSSAPGLARLGRPSGTLPGTRGTRVAQGSPRNDRRLQAGARRGKWIGDWTGLAAVPRSLKVDLPPRPHRRAPRAAFPAPHPALSTKSAGASAQHLRGGCASSRLSRDV